MSKISKTFDIFTMYREFFKDYWREKKLIYTRSQTHVCTWVKDSTQFFKRDILYIHVFVWIPGLLPVKLHHSLFTGLWIKFMLCISVL